MMMEAKGIEGVVGLTQWFKRMESVFHISNCAVENQVKFATCTLHGISLTWWNTHVKTVGHDAAYDQEIGDRDLESEESDVVEKYVGRLPDMIQGTAMSTKPKRMEEDFKMANNLMDQKLRTTLAGLTQLGLVRKGSIADLCQSVPSATTTIMVCVHRSATSATRLATWPGIARVLAMLTLGHFKRECPKLNNKNHGGNGNAPAKAYVVGNAGTNPNSNVVTATFLLNNRYASILFDTGADRSFISTTFSSLIDITPTTLDHYYDVELADGKIIGINTIIRGCTLNFLNHPFNIDLMPVKLGSFDVIIGTDWLAKYHAVIVCDEKLVRIP
ncbi:putative reverse transcriptase domain-containing protein [Tanacetum coccineum]